MIVNDTIICPSSNKIASWSMYFQRYTCPHCGWEGTDMPKTKKKNNIDYVYCNSPEDIRWWLSGAGRDGNGLNGFSYIAYSWKKLEDASQIISVSYDQSKGMYLVVFKVRDE